MRSLPGHANAESSFEALGIAVFRQDAQGVYTWVNAAFSSFAFGKPPCNIEGKHREQVPLIFDGLNEEGDELVMRSALPYFKLHVGCLSQGWPASVLVQKHGVWDREHNLMGTVGCICRVSHFNPFAGLPSMVDPGFLEKMVPYLSDLIFWKDGFGVIRGGNARYNNFVGQQPPSKEEQFWDEQPYQLFTEDDESVRHGFWVRRRIDFFDGLQCFSSVLAKHAIGSQGEGSGIITVISPSRQRYCKPSCT